MAHEMIRLNSFGLTRWHIIPVLIATCFVLFQKGCVLTPGPSSAQIRPDAQAQLMVPVLPLVQPKEPVRFHNPDDNPPSPGSPRRTLKHASDLLRQAASMLDRNDRTALRLILQALTILKHEIMRGNKGPEYERISTQGPDQPNAAPEHVHTLVTFRMDEVGHIGT